MCHKLLSSAFFWNLFKFVLYSIYSTLNINTTTIYNSLFLISSSSFNHFILYGFSFIIMTTSTCRTAVLCAPMLFSIFLTLFLLISTAGRLNGLYPSKTGGVAPVSGQLIEQGERDLRGLPPRGVRDSIGGTFNDTGPCEYRSCTIVLYASQCVLCQCVLC